MTGICSPILNRAFEGVCHQDSFHPKNHLEYVSLTFKESVASSTHRQNVDIVDSSSTLFFTVFQHLCNLSNSHSYYCKPSVSMDFDTPTVVTSIEVLISKHLDD